jgi:hypothetical protein
MAHLPFPLLQWSGLCAGVSCGKADWELALGPPSESSLLFSPLLSPGLAGTFQPLVALATWQSTRRHGGASVVGRFGHLGPHVEHRLMGS